MPKDEPATERPASLPRSRKGLATRARLLEAAKAVFEDAGFIEARITDIADRAGLSHGSFYHYFDSKEQVFREVAESQESLLTAFDGDEGPEEEEKAPPLSEVDRIRRANRKYFERYRDNGRIMGVIEEVSRYDAFVNEGRMRRQKHFADRAERSIRRLQALGAADPAIDPELAAVALGSMVGRFAELWLIEGWGTYEFDDVVEQVTRLWANAIGLDDPSLTTPRPRKAPSRPATAAKPRTKAKAKHPAKP